mmetsp:Transcript_126733/g.370364  ORF Transcript_126733/g.370364 Transcript_126733/m.370364 type:complete len:242 (-) Transcript_126733:1296-2021(-)
MDRYRDELQEMTRRGVRRRHVHELHHIKDIETLDPLHVKHGNDPAPQLADQVGGGGRLQSSVEHLQASLHPLGPCQLFEMNEAREVGDLCKAQPERPLDQVLAQHSVVHPLLRIRLHGVEVRRQEARHGSSHCKCRRRDHVLARKALDDVQREGHAVVEKALRRGHIQHHNLQHTQSEGDLQRIGPSFEMFHKGCKQLQSRDGLSTLVQMHKVCHLSAGKPGCAALFLYPHDRWDVRTVMV